MDVVVFYIVGGIALLSAIAMIANRNPVASAMWLILTMFCLAVLFLLLSAHLIAILEVLIYAGAIMVLFLFVIMLLNLREYTSDLIIGKKTSFLQYILMGGGLVISVIKIISVLFNHNHRLNDVVLSKDFGMIKRFGRLLFVEYIVPFELISVLLLAALIGAVVLAKSKLT